jgi:drug/metabolite transporter (DMT)-like permease
MTRSRASLALAATVVLWASAFPAIKVGLDGYGVAGLSVLRLAVASIVLALIAPLLGVRRPRRTDLPLIVVCGLTGMTAYQLLLNFGEVPVPAGTASLLVATTPVFSAILAAAFLGERLTVVRVTGSMVAVAGSAVIALAGGHARYTAAAWVVLAAAVVQGMYHCCSKPLLARYTGVEVASYAMWAGTVFVLPLAPSAFRGLLTAPAAATAAAVYLGVLPSAADFVVWGCAVARHSVTVATSALYLVPVVAIAVAFVWLGELPSLIELAGGLVSIVGVVMLSLRRKPAGPAAIGPRPGNAVRANRPDAATVRPGPNRSALTVRP